MSTYAAYDGNEFTWNGLTYKVIVRDYGGGVKLAWLDRNLGASQVATAIDDTAAYGDLYQWGRDTDGHEKRTSGTTATLSTTDTPGHDDFITASAAPTDWRSPQNDDLWQGVDGINNPAPPGWRLPTFAETEAERATWGSNNSAGAFASVLKLMSDGHRQNNGNISLTAGYGYIWTSSIFNTASYVLLLQPTTASTSGGSRVNGYGVRLVATAEDPPAPPPPIDPLLRINDLQILVDPKLIFSANDLRGKGRSNKSYTIVIPRNKHNNKLLSNFFGQKLLKTISYPARYIYKGVNMTGRLLLTDVDDYRANGLFISGNGSLWEEMANVQLSDVDFSVYDLVYNDTNVKVTTASTPVLFDFTDRGAYLEDGKIDITERYPALHLPTILTTLFNSFGVGIESNGFKEQIDGMYLLFTQSKDIRNSAEWLKESTYKATLPTDTVSLDGEGTGALAWDETLALMDTNPDGFDTNGNYTNVPNYQYTVPETGTYAFIAVATLEYSLDAAGGGTAIFAGNVADVSLVIKKNGATVRTVTEEVAAVGGITPITITANTRPSRFEAGDLITVHSLLEGTITGFTMGTETAFTQSIDDAEVYNVPSMWYGAGDTINIADILPDLTVNEFLKKLFTYLSVSVFYDIRQNSVTLVAGTPSLEIVDELTVWDYTERLEESYNTELMQPQDKVFTPDNEEIIIDATYPVVQKQLDFAKSFIYYIERQAGIQEAYPVLWNEGNPTRTGTTIPEANTEGALRLVQYAETGLIDIVQTYGGDAADDESNEKLTWKFDNITIAPYHRFDATVERVEVECFAKMEIEKLYSLTSFKGAITLRDRYTGNVIRNILLSEAEQIDGNIYKITGYPVTNIPTNDLPIFVGVLVVDESETPIVDENENNVTI